MIEKKFNDKWKFWENKDSFALVWNVPETAKEITVPHDAMFEKNAHADSLNGGNTGYYDGAFYNYVKTLYAPADYKEKTVILKFEGVYMNAMVYINGELAGKNMFGYSTFYVPLNDFLRYGEENEIRVQVRNGAMTNSRWYSGGGIYRDVYLLVSDVTHLVPEGIQIKTAEADETLAVLDIATEVKTRKYAPSRVVLETVIRDAEGNEVAKARSPFVLFEQEERIIKQRVTVDSPERWSDEKPSLYTCDKQSVRGWGISGRSGDNFRHPDLAGGCEARAACERGNGEASRSLHPSRQRSAWCGHLRGCPIPPNQTAEGSWLQCGPDVPSPDGACDAAGVRPFGHVRDGRNVRHVEPDEIRLRLRPLFPGMVGKGCDGDGPQGFQPSGRDPLFCRE